MDHLGCWARQDGTCVACSCSGRCFWPSRGACSLKRTDPAFTTLDLPELITIDIQSRDGAVGVGLRSRNSIGERSGCLLVRLDTASLEVWTLSGTADQPGESSCDGFGALACNGQRSPH